MTTPEGSSEPGRSPVRPLPDSAYRRMSLVLRVGLALALAILFGGTVAFLLRHPGETSQSVLANNPILDYLSLPGLAAGLVEGHTQAVLTLGLVALVAIPIVRVLSGLVYFERAGERAMTAIAATVFALLLLGLLVIGPLIR